MDPNTDILDFLNSAQFSELNPQDIIDLTATDSRNTPVKDQEPDTSFEWVLDETLSGSIQNSSLREFLSTENIEESLSINQPLLTKPQDIDTYLSTLFPGEFLFTEMEDLEESLQLSSDQSLLAKSQDFDTYLSTLPGELLFTGIGSPAELLSTEMLGLGDPLLNLLRNPNQPPPTESQGLDVCLDNLIPSSEDYSDYGKLLTEYHTAMYATPDL